MPQFLFQHFQNKIFGLNFEKTCFQHSYFDSINHYFVVPLTTTTHSKSKMKYSITYNHNSVMEPNFSLSSLLFHISLFLLVFSTVFISTSTQSLKAFLH